MSARRARLQQRAETGSRGARIALELQEDPTRFLSTVQIGITLVGILAGTFSGATLAERLAARALQQGVPASLAEPAAVALVVLVVTYLSLVVGELVPKRIAMAHADAIACRVAPLISSLATLTRPAVTLLRLSTNGLLQILGVRLEARSRISDEEINALIAESAAQGVIEPQERDMVEEVLRLADRPVRTVMTHRRDVVWIDVEATREELEAIIREHDHSRYPVCTGSLDEVLGYVRTRELLGALTGTSAIDLRTQLREPLMVAETLSTLELMRMFRRARPHIAFVLDEFGGFLGLVTPTDILETIAGELAELKPEAPSAQRREDGSWLVDGQLELQALERTIGAGGLARAGEFTTIAGLVLEHLGRLPQPGETLLLGGWRIEVVDLDGHRIDKVLLTPLAARRAAVGEGSGGR